MTSCPQNRSNLEKNHLNWLTPDNTRSRCKRRNSKLGKPNWRSRLLYDKLFIPRSLFVDRLWTFSNCSMSRTRLGDEIMLLYSKIWCKWVTKAHTSRRGVVYERAYLLQTGSCEKEALGLNRFYWCRVFPLLKWEIPPGSDHHKVK